MEMIYSTLKYLDDTDFNNLLLYEIATKYCPNNLIKLNKEFNENKKNLLYVANKVNNKLNELNFDKCLINDEDSG